MKKVHWFSPLVAMLSACILAGCGGGDEPAVEEDPKEPAGEGGGDLKGELKKAGEHLKEAGGIAAKKAADATKKLGGLLESEWAGAKDSAHEAKEKLVEAYGENIEEATQRLEEWKSKVGGASEEQLEALEMEIAEAKERLEELKGASAKNWDATKGAFNVGWEELRGAFKKAKDEFDSRRE